MIRRRRAFNYIHKEDIDGITNWLNNKIDQVIKDNNILQFNNGRNDIDTIVDYMYDKVKMALAWTEETPQQERVWFTMVMDSKNYLRKFIRHYIYKNFKYIQK